MAISVGVYGEVHRGSTKFGYDLKGKTDDIGVAGGLVLDTKISKSDSFYYRLRVGAGQSWGAGFTFTNASIIQTLGVSPAALHWNMFRFWFGPKIGLHYINAKNTTPAIPAEMLFGGIQIFKFDTTFEMNSFKGDIGLVLAGFNFDFGKFFTISFEFGANYGFMIGKCDYKTSTNWLTASGETIEGFTAISLLYRFNSNNLVKTEESNIPDETEKAKKLKIEIE